MYMIKFIKVKYLFSGIIAIFVCSCTQPAYHRASGEFDREDQKILQSDIEIKEFIVSHYHRKKILPFSNNKSVVIRLMNEENFEDIKSVIFADNLKFEHGQRDIAIHPKDGNKPYEDDGLDYSGDYIYENNVTCIQIEKFTIPKEANRLEVYVGVYRSGLDASGMVYVFKKTKKGWLAEQCKLIWLS